MAEFKLRLRDPSVMRSFEKHVIDLIERASPGEVRLSVPRAAWMKEYASYEVSIQTRGYDDICTGKTIADA